MELRLAYIAGSVHAANWLSELNTVSLRNVQSAKMSICRDPARAMINEDQSTKDTDFITTVDHHTRCGGAH